MTSALLSLGGNLGDRFGYLRGAIDGLADVLVRASGVYESPPWGDPDQPAYLNAVALVHADGATACDWLARAQALEEQAGRVRDPERRFGPRTLDVDVIMVWSDDGRPIVSADPDLTLPHPRAHERPFILRPWSDIQPYAKLPCRGWIGELLQTPADLAGVAPRADLTLAPEEDVL
jgi:2-amino-4-hydroxy-6-hydroxymethyldihydropteridine diphosphokinase